MSALVLIIRATRNQHCAGISRLEATRVCANPTSPIMMAQNALVCVPLPTAINMQHAQIQLTDSNLWPSVHVNKDMRAMERFVLK